MAEHIEQEVTCRQCVHNAACINMLRKMFHDVTDEEIEKVENRKNDCRFFKFTSDVVEVRHGYWIPYLDGEHIMPERYYQCSECGRRGYTRRYPYCNCGAKMDGKGEE